MTGEITLSGLVLPVGGIKEKALAARRQGVKTMILPAQNEDDLDELSPEARRDMTFRPVSTFEEVVEVALGPLPVPACPCRQHRCRFARRARGRRLSGVGRVLHLRARVRARQPPGRSHQRLRGVAARPADSRLHEGVAMAAGPHDPVPATIVNRPSTRAPSSATACSSTSRRPSRPRRRSRPRR